jgi:DNA topoisomerase-1
MNKNKTNKTNKPLVNIKNTPYLIIVESPFKCKKIEKFLGFQYKCIASNGHFREISKINTKEKENAYEPVFEIIPLKQKHVDNIREIISYFRDSPENIFIATDDDREGEAIAWHICMTFELPIEKVHRILFHEITEPAIKEAVLNPMKIRMNIVFAQHARQVLDRLVGFQISPLLTKRMNNNGEMKYLSAGRCQTPALRLIYDRENTLDIDIDIDIDIDTNTYTINGFFFSQQLKFVLSQKLITKEKCISFLEKSREFSHEMKIENPQQKNISPPLPLNTSSLLQSANTLFQLSSKETMNYCQQLYQAGYITYMRTESVVYSKTFISKVNKYIAGTFSPEYIGNIELLQNQNQNDCPHEAIRVTDLYCKEISLSMLKESPKQKEQRQKLYSFIWKRSIESCMSDYVYKQTIVKITAPLPEYYYEYVVDIPVFLGWTVIDIDNRKDNQKNGILLFLQSAKSPIKCMKIECEVYIPERKGHYCESGLIRDLEKYGIGRPSTFSIILQCIQERDYVRKQNIEGKPIEYTNIMLDNLKNGEIIFLKKERIIGKEKNKLVLQELGKCIIDELIPTFNDLFSYDYTKKMEMELDKISNGNNNVWNSICRECDKTIAKNAKRWKMEMKQIYPIDDKHELIFIKTGPIIRIKDDNDGDDNGKKTNYKRIKSNLKIDFEKLRNKKYNLEELLEIPKDILGEYEGYPLYLKNGQYGLYVTWGEKKEKISLDQNKKIEDINLQYIVDYLSAKKHIPLPKQIIRVLNEHISIRKGKYGHYIHCSIPGKDKDTEFYNIKLFPGDYLKCETNELLRWLENTYGII